MSWALLYCRLPPAPRTDLDPNHADRYAFGTLRADVQGAEVTLQLTDVDGDEITMSFNRCHAAKLTRYLRSERTGVSIIGRGRLLGEPAGRGTRRELCLYAEGHWDEPKRLSRAALIWLSPEWGVRVAATLDALLLPDEVPV